MIAAQSSGPQAVTPTGQTPGLPLLPTQSRPSAAVSREPSDGQWRPGIYGLLAFLLVFGLGGLWWLRGRPGEPLAPPPPLLASLPPPVPVVEALPPPALPPPPVAIAPPPIKPVPMVRRPPPTSHVRPAVKAEPSDAVASDKKRREVDLKFQELKGEYLEFKKQYGARLEGRWQQILSDIALGRRDQGLGDAIDGLRRDIKQLKSEPR
jgi:hypothetical protein